MYWILGRLLIPLELVKCGGAGREGSDEEGDNTQINTSH